ncbi:MerC domain-containing protein [Pyxidicoccus xibeiensis]|uniref:MerC domain-containing protein n=1 Tax=Pyxidicoccus xibeiensis TaxID=2906759 RepID=UPI0020A7158A|nr:MerC domain-containing protein [Pyxidicoccus xibeiensis]MCP3142567.1 MerC domain-containing protein [Pyxidicoccus xibeiensis]
MIASEPNAPVASRWDGLGQLVSALCIVHCVGVPLVLGLLPAAVAGLLEDEAVHHWLLLLVTVTALAAFVPGWRHHRRGSAAALAGVGLALLLGGAFGVPEDASGPWEMGLTLAGGGVMALAHRRNHALCRDCCPPEAG